jgi:hypothetical protein
MSKHLARVAPERDHGVDTGKASSAGDKSNPGSGSISMHALPAARRCVLAAPQP